MEPELLYEAKVKILPGVDIGVVHEGRRVNFPFTGDAIGPKINGKLDGVDYVLGRPDGVGILHVHGVITTDIGDRISVEASAFTTPTKEEGWSAVKGVETFRTSSKELSWLNSTQGVEEGLTSLKMRELNAKVYKI